MSRFLVTVKNGSRVLAQFEAMAPDRFTCLVQHMETADLLGGYASVRPIAVAVIAWVPQV